jgi:hypothetical protein
MKLLDKVKKFFKNTFPEVKIDPEVQSMVDLGLISPTQASNVTQVPFQIQKIQVTAKSRTMVAQWNHEPDLSDEWYSERYNLDFSECPQWNKEIYATVYDHFADTQTSMYPVTLTRELPRGSGKSTFFRKLIENLYEAMRNDPKLMVNKVVYIGANTTQCREFCKYFLQTQTNNFHQTGFLVWTANLAQALDNSKLYPAGKNILYILDDALDDPNSFTTQSIKDRHDKVMIVKLYTPR